MTFVGMAAMLAANFIVGLALVSALGRPALVAMGRWEKAGLALLGGMLASAFVALLAMMGGMRLGPAPWIAVTAVAAVALAARPRATASLFARGYPAEPLFPERWMGWAIAVPMFALVSWSILAAVTLPTTDYDGIVIWSYRVKVLLAEGMLDSPSLRDPSRFVAQPLHSYLLPVLEAGYCLAAGGYSEAACRVPHAVFYLGYLMVVGGAAGMVQRAGWRLAVGASLLLMPLMATGASMLSAREPVTAACALASTLLLARWAGSGHGPLLAGSALFALLVHQLKFEGTPFAMGWAAGVVVLVMRSKQPNRAGTQAVAAAAVFLLAIPWALEKRGIPPVNIDPFMADWTQVFQLRVPHLATAAWLLVSEILFRPELYGVAGLVAIAALARGWRGGDAWRSLALLAPVGALVAAVILVYAMRQSQLPEERNSSITRRALIILPTLVFAAAVGIPRRRENAG